MKKYLLLLTIMALLLATPAAYAELYSWTDREGNGHFTDDISKVPDQYRAQARANKIADEENDRAEHKGQQEDRSSAGYGAKKAKKGERAAEHTDKNGRGGAYWRARSEALRQDLEELRQDYESLSSEERACEESHRINYLGKGTDCAAMYRNRKERLELQIEHARKKLEVDLPDEARKLDAYPGWIR
jgi:hypothetical protein